ncbi:hypothetical protein B5F88_13885 [Flavonifractor sp. An306]|nr:hypothetical protein B5F88_13885 [Flavonifractor sp. An306]
MPNTVLGKVSLTPRGAYRSGARYTALDLVGHEGGGYIALREVQDIAPSDDGVNWMLLAARGGEGIQGEQGIPGYVFTPSVSAEGVVSWTNNGDLPNPDPVDIMGPEGPRGPQGDSVVSIEHTGGTGAPGTTDTYTVKLSNGSIAGAFQVYNGADGNGAGDFKADGSVPMTGNLQMGGNRVVDVGSAQESTDAVNKSDLDKAIQSVTITTDAEPVEGSHNPVQSGGVFSALSNKVNKNTPIIWYDLQLQDGFKPSAYAKYGKDDAGWVQIAGAVTYPGGTLKENEVIAILPEGYRPSALIPIPLIQSSGNWAIFGWIDTAGNIKLTGISPPNGFNQMYGISLGATFKAY